MRKIYLKNAIAISSLYILANLAYAKISDLTADYDLRKKDLTFLDVKIDLAQNKSKDKTIIIQSDYLCTISGTIENELLPIHGQVVLQCMSHGNKNYWYLYSKDRSIMNFFAYGDGDSLKDATIYGKIVGLENGNVVIDAKKVLKK